MPADRLSVVVDGMASAKVTTQEELNTAVANAKTAGKTQIVLDGADFDLPTTDAKNKDIIFYGGTENTVIDATSVNHNGMGHITGATITFDNVTVNWAQANEGYQGLANAKKVVYRNCTINDTQFMYGDADFINCEFKISDGYTGYSVYGRGKGTLTFTDCTFDTAGRAIMLYSDHQTDIKVKLNNCSFSDNGAYIGNKAAVETGDNLLNAPVNTSKFDIEIKNCTVTGFEPNNSTSPLWGNKDNIPAERLHVVVICGTHKYQETSGGDATCTAQGYTTYTCTNCGDSYNGAYIPALGHNWNAGKETKPAGESSTGEMTYTCSRCDVTNKEVIPALGHTHKYTTSNVAATCTTDGYTLTFCACGDETKSVTKATGHSYKNEPVAATCTAQGYTTHTCGKCGHSYNDNYVAANGHSWTKNESNSVSATADANGVAIYDCNNCDATKSETIPKKGHTFDGGTTVAPTCTEQGYTEYTCETCKDGNVTHTYRDKLQDAKGHSLISKATPATCKAKGYTTYSCACGYTFIDNITAMIEHTWAVTDMKAASGNTEGSKTYTCSGCGAKKTETIPKIGCSFDAKVTAPTCTEQGYTTFTCTTCTGTAANHSYTGNYVAAAGHTLSSVVTVPTCTEKGYTTHTCANCDYKVKSAVTDMVPHNYKLVDTKAANSTEDGYISYKCSGNKCDTEKVEVIPALGHSFEVESTTPATCEKEGEITYTCKNCTDGSHTYTEAIPATGHNWVKGTPVPVTCTTSGYTPNTCDNCGAKRNTDLVAMIDHSFNTAGVCNCGAVNAAAIAEGQKLTDNVAPLTTVADTLSYSDTTELQNAMKEAGNISDDLTSELVDISLKIEGTENSLTANNFPAEGYEFSIDLPANADANTVVVSHMITETYGGHLAGDIEILPSEVRDGKVYFRTYSTSPVLLSYETTTSTPDPTPDSKPSTGGGFSGSYNYPVSTPKVDNGKVTLSDNNAVAGETVTATVKPDNGYGVAEVIVTDEKGNVIPVTYLGNGEYTFVMPAGKVNIETVCKPAITLTVGNTNANVFGKNVKNDVAPIITPEGRTMLPIRFITEALDGNVAWNEATQTVTITKDGVNVQIIIGADYAYINGEKVKLDSPAFIANGRTYLPVRFVSEALGATVNWDAKTQQVVIMK